MPQHVLHILVLLNHLNQDKTDAVHVNSRDTIWRIGHDGARPNSPSRPEGTIIGVILGAALSNPVLHGLVNATGSSPSAPGGFRRGGPPGAGAPGAGFGNPFRAGASTLSDLHAAVGATVLLYGAIAAALIAVVGSAVPAYVIAKIRPAEVLRGE